MTDPRTDEDRIVGIVQASDMDPIPIDYQLDFDSANKDQTTTVTSGGSETVTFTPPSGEAWKLKGFGFYAPGISGAGGTNHQFLVYIWESITLLNGVSNPTDNLAYSSSSLRGTIERWPRTDVAAVLTLKDKIVTPSWPLEVEYQNNTDSDQTSERQYRLFYQILNKVS